MLLKAGTDSRTMKGSVRVKISVPELIVTSAAISAWLTASHPSSEVKQRRRGGGGGAALLQYTEHHALQEGLLYRPKSTNIQVRTGDLPHVKRT